MNALTRFDTTALQQLNRAIIGFDRLFADRAYSNQTYPPYNIVKHGEDSYEIEVAVAGFKLGEIDVEGQVQLGHNVKVGYFAQNQASLLDPDLTVFETVDQVAEGDIRTQIKNMLGRFMFSGDDINKKVGVLSGGERTRLAMVKLLLEPVNLLILDEPTNHLDLKSKDVLKEALLDFEGTLILVSHDRAFLMGLANKVFEFKDKRVIEHLETIDEFLERNRIKNIAELNLAK